MSASTRQATSDTGASHSPCFDVVRDFPSVRGTVAVVREVLADLDTPVSAYLKIRDTGPSFLLESVEGGEHVGRYSFIGNGSWRWELPGQGVATTVGSRQGPDVRPAAFAPLRAHLEQNRQLFPAERRGFDGGVLGYISYEAVRHIERVPVARHDALGVPDAIFMGVETLLVFDHVRHTIRVVTHMRLDEPRSVAYEEAVARIDQLVDRLRGPLPELACAISLRHGVTPRLDVQSNVTASSFTAMVRAAQEHIRKGDILQVVLSQRLSLPMSTDPFTLYRALRVVSPSPYLYFLDFGDHQLVGASPELLIQVERGTVTSRPIAGTRPRGHDPDEDRALEAELLADEKERAEHIMLVDLARNDVGRVCIPGTVGVGRLMQVERFSHVMHIVSDVTGSLHADRTAEDALWSAFPAGTVSGAPKIRAMEIIAALEPDRRGPYAGAVGFWTPDGTIECAITIRTALVRDGTVHVQAGAGIVADSVPEREYEETMNKARALLVAAGSVEP